VHDFVLLPGCLLLATVVGYLQFQYAIFGEHWGLGALLPALACLWAARRTPSTIAASSLSASPASLAGSGSPSHPSRCSTGIPSPTAPSSPSASPSALPSACSPSPSTAAASSGTSPSPRSVSALTSSSSPGSP